MSSGKENQRQQSRRTPRVPQCSACKGLCNILFLCWPERSRVLANRQIDRQLTSKHDDDADGNGQSRRTSLWAAKVASLDESTFPKDEAAVWGVKQMVKLLEHVWGNLLSWFIFPGPALHEERLLYNGTLMLRMRMTPQKNHWATGEVG